MHTECAQYQAIRGAATKDLPLAFQVRGRQFLIAKSEVEARLASVEPQPVTTHFVLVGGRRYPVRQVLAEITGLPSVAIATSHAYDILARLGFRPDEEEDDQMAVSTALATTPPPPPDENAAITAVCIFLEEQGFEIRHVSSTDEVGVDVDAERCGLHVLLEAKGLTSSKRGTPNYGKPFTVQQRRHHVAEAVMTACELVSRHPEAKVALALPTDRVHQSRVAAVAPVLQRLGIAVLWVFPGGAVQAWNAPWLQAGPEA